MRRFLPLVLLCVGAAGAHLHAGPPVPQAKAANSPSSVLFAATIQYAEPEAWEHTPASSARAVEVAEEIVRGQRVNLLLSFTELAFDDAGRADVVYDVSLRAPDGSVQVLGKDLPAANDIVPEANRHLVFRAVRSVGFAVPATGPLGTYRYVARVRDRVAKAEVEVSGEVRVVDQDKDPVLPPGFDSGSLNEWLIHYYERPSPRLALPVARFLAHDQRLAKNERAWPAILGTYEMILRDNPWLVTRFQAQALAPGTDPAERSTLLFLLAYVRRHDPAAANFLPEAKRESFRQVQAQEWADPDREFLNGSQLDTLWGRFFATGGFAPIERLVTALDYQKFQGRLQAFKQLNPRPPTVPVEVYKDAVYGAAVWSLRANAQQHRLVRDYLAYLMKHPDTPPDRAYQIASIIGAEVRGPDGKVIQRAEGKPHAP